MSNSRAPGVLQALAAVFGRQPTGGARIGFEHQVFALATAVMLGACLLYAPVYWFVLEERVGAWVILLGVIPLWAALHAYSRTGSYRLGLHLISVGANTVLTFLVVWQGGVSSAVAPWLILMPIALITCADLVGGGFWFSVALLELIGLGMLQLYGVELPRHRGSDPEMLFIVAQPGLCGVVFVFLWIVGRNRQLNDRVLAERTEDLAKARDLAEAASRTKTQFLANMSHEIRTPMNGVLGATEYLANTVLTEEQRHFVQLMKQSGENLLCLLNDVLDFSKIEAGKMALEHITFSPREVVESVAELFAARASEKGLDLTCRVAPDVAEQVRGDPARVRQILANLMGNAIKFTPAGEVGIEAVHRAGPDGNHIEFIVRDTGIGIDATARAGLFRPFTQADGSTTRLYGGSGLGLAISADLTRLMQGQLSVDSTPGHGSTFRCSLPFEPVDQPGGAAPRLPASCRVHVLEPNPRHLRAIEEMLGCMGAACLAASDLASAQAAGPGDLLVASTLLQSIGQCRQLAAMTPGRRVIVMAPVGWQLPDEPGGCAITVLRKPVRLAMLHQALSPAHGHATAGAASAPNAPLAARVLLAEDNLVNQQIALALLQRFGCSVDVVSDGAAAVAAWSAGTYDLILMDCQMPVMDGYDATQAIRRIEADEHRRRTPIVAVTANAMSGDREECLAAGMEDHVPKPYNLAALRRTLERWGARTALDHEG